MIEEWSVRYKPDVSKKSQTGFLLSLNQSTAISYGLSIPNFITNNMYNAQ